MRFRVEVEFKKNVDTHFIREHGKWYGFVGKVGFCKEIAAYIEAHENAGREFDTTGQLIRYDEMITVTLIREQGVWYIIEIDLADAPVVSYSVRHIWKHVFNGAHAIIARVADGWYSIRAGASPAYA